MKKNFLFALSVALLLGACDRQGTWTDEQQGRLRESVAQQRERFGLQYMEDRDFSTLQKNAVNVLSEIFPDYAMYDSLPDRDATLDGIVTDCISDMAGGDYEYLDKLFPYARLAATGLVPAGGLPGNFYECLAGKLRGAYFNPDVFVMSLLADPAAAGLLRETIRQCGGAE